MLDATPRDHTSAIRESGQPRGATVSGTPRGARKALLAEAQVDALERAVVHDDDVEHLHDAEGRIAEESAS